MDSVARAIAIDGTEYRVRFRGFENPLDAVASGGREARLEPWTLGVHLDALRSCLAPNVEGLALDRSAFIEAVLARSGVPLELAPCFGPLALWWAAGGDPVPDAEPVTELDLGTCRARLRAWSHGERMQALAAALSEQDGLAVDVVSYLQAMLRACVVKLEPAMDVSDLDSAAAARLVRALTSLNTSTPEDTDAVLAGLEDNGQMARATLRLCRALGWTPSQVSAAPAVEVDRLLALLDRSEGRRGHREHARPRRIAEMPDAVVIRIEDA